MITAHPRVPEMSISLAAVTSARNTVRLHSGMKFTVSAFTKTCLTLTSERAIPISIRLGSQAFMDDKDLPTVLTGDPAGLPIVTSGLVRIGMIAEVVDVQSSAGEQLMALRIDLTPQTTDNHAIVFENIPDGNITLRQDGRPDRLIGRVIRAAAGTGRVNGTENLGNGALSEAGQTALVLSTSPDATAPTSRFVERRGGVSMTTVADNHPYAMLIKDSIPALALKGFAFGGKSHIADVQRESGDWEPFPSIVGHCADTFVRPHPKGQVIVIRIRPTTVTSSGQAIQAVAIQYEKSSLADATKRKIPVISGLHTLRISPTDPGRVASLKIRISELLFVMNVKPFSKTWDTASLPDGLHSVNVELLDESGALITTTRQEVYVHNRNVATELSACQW